MDYMEKEANAQMQKLLNDHSAFQEKFAASTDTYLKTKIREESIVEKILDVKTVDENHPQVQKDINSDTLYYLEEIEQDALAMEVAMRADAQPRWVDGKRYQIRPGKIESEEVKKNKMELRVADNIIKFIKENNVDAVNRVQDTVGMRTFRAALGITKTVLGMDKAGPLDFTDYTDSIDWTTGARKIDMVNLMNSIVRKELVPIRWLMSSSAYNVFSAMDSSEIGDMAGPIFKERFEGDILKMPAVTTIKSGLIDPLTGHNLFDYEDETGVYSDIYLFVDTDYLGRIIKIDDDQLWSEWKKEVFFWQTWRYSGLGLGDFRGISMMRVQLEGERGQQEA